MPFFLETIRYLHLPLPGGMILAADYSQLELRVLAHLSKDQRLLQVSGSSRRSKFTSACRRSSRKQTSPQVLNGGADVFRCIAAEWKNVDPDSVTDSLRQQAKQVQPDGRDGDQDELACIPTCDC